MFKEIIKVLSVDQAWGHGHPRGGGRIFVSSIQIQFVFNSNCLNISIPIQFQINSIVVFPTQTCVKRNNMQRIYRI